MNVARRVGLAAVLVVVLGALVPAAHAQSDTRSEKDTLKLPVTMDKVWMRGEKKKGIGKLRVFKHSGDLTITDAGLEFVAKKASFFFPMESLTMVSFGTMGRDVDVRWAVVGIREGETTRVIGFRDGRKLGYGQETELIYENLVRAAEKHRVAQFYAADGLKSYTSIDAQLVLTISEDWNVYVLTSIFVGEEAPWGKTVFSPVESEELELRENDAELRGMYKGEHSAILLDRREASFAMTCRGISRKATQKILSSSEADEIFGRNSTVVDPLAVSELVIAGCQGLKIKGSTRGADGIERVLDLRIFAHAGTLFTLGIRSQLDDYPERSRQLDALVDGLRLPLARR